ncbi:MAG: phosphoribosylformylglycinamidine synthase subunit PurQ [Deltaproteobacteria bacterium]|nr:phosphoribosylformylglycinamidine synthase subunit PurQ [Deltaproteobacteria bacterium]
MKVTVITFPGSNCDRDVQRAFLGLGASLIIGWHEDTKLEATDAVILPGGFSYGDYLRTGAMAARAHIMPEVKAFADRGGAVLGICNGFQILCEAGMLEGALLRNDSLSFICEDVKIDVEQADTKWTRGLAGKTLRLPIAHGDGNFYADEATLDRLEAEKRVVFRYEARNPNGSKRRIAGICNANRNVVGLMPHPERASDVLLGSTDGLQILGAILEGGAR